MLVIKFFLLKRLIFMSEIEAWDLSRVLDKTRIIFVDGKWKKLDKEIN